MPTVLVVDDEENIRDLVGLYLRAAGFAIETAANGREAVAKFRVSAPDLIVLDFTMPDMTGAEVCTVVRAESSTPIIMLTARNSDLDKVALLEAGADDYVVKPFSPPELVARVRAVLRRGPHALRSEPTPPAVGGVGTALCVGALSLDSETREVSVDGAPIVLTAREFDLLRALASRPGAVLSREQLIEAVGGSAEFSEVRGIDVHIRHLREKLGDDASSPRFLETVRGVGYRVRRDAI
ncbi:MAG: response regulator transcription factor [Coriobacteriia bacterium]|nr:response regulator transcription factor [Coriobacteriia bacterium]